MADEQDVTVESSPQLAEAVASSPEVEQEVTQQVPDEQTPTAEDEGVGQEQETEQPAEERIPYSRLKEVVDEKNYWRDVAIKQSELQKPPQELQQPETAPQELGNNAEEREFWRLQRQIAREEAMKVAGEKEKKMSAAIEFLTAEITNSKIQNFRAKHPEIKPNSMEEKEIAQKVNQGYKLEDAYKVVMWDTKVADATKQAKKTIKKNIETKKQANVESKSISSSAIPTKENLTLRQEIERAAETMDL